jgi:plastocyanin domain-containing protein
MRTTIQRFGFAILPVTLLVTVAACKRGDAGSATAAPADGKPIAIRADENGFTPTSVAVKKGSPASLIFTRTSDETCAKEVVFPEIKLKKDLPLNAPVTVDVPSGDARTLTFQCGMGMFKGKVVIE